MFERLADECIHDLRHIFGLDNRWGRLPYDILSTVTAESYDITDYSMHNRSYRYLQQPAPADAAAADAAAENHLAGAAAAAGAAAGAVTFPFGFGLSLSSFSLEMATKPECARNPRDPVAASSCESDRLPRQARD